jgi:hypothetical protein
MLDRKTVLVFALRQSAVVFSFSAIAIALNSCSQRVDNLARLTMNQCDPAVIRHAAMPLLSGYKYTNNLAGFVVPFDKVPKTIKSMPIFSKDPDLIITWWVATNDDALAFVNGSGFGHWGIVVCQNENSREFDGWAGYTYWTNGIYFYNGQ